MLRIWVLLLAFLPATLLAEVEQRPRNAPWLEPAFAGQTRAPHNKSGFTLAANTFATGLENPWGIAALPDGSYLVTERPGNMRLILADGTVSNPITGVPDVYNLSQGGLLDVAISPDFAKDRLVYWTYAKPLGLARSVTAAARGVLSEDAKSLSQVEDIFVQDPWSLSPLHYGSRVVFDGKGHVFITTGEHARRAESILAQDLNTTYGKVIRVFPDGSTPDNNPFAKGGGVETIWSYGHRNIQGAAIEPGTGRLWTIEHGPRGGDELNTPEPGKNYGWPVITYGINYNGSEVGEGITQAEGMEQPRYFWDPVIAPSGMSFYSGTMFQEWEGNLLIAGLAGALVRVVIEGDRIIGEEYLLTDLGRIRDVEVISDGSLLILIDDADGQVMRITRE